MTRPVWAVGILLLALALPVQAAPEPLTGTAMLMPPAPEPYTPPMGMPVPTMPPDKLPVTAATVPQATAVQVARSLFPADLVAAQPNVELMASSPSRSVWTLAWEGEAAYIHVSVDAQDGQVVGADRWSRLPGLPQGGRMSQAEAEAKAAAWVQKLAPGAQSSLVAAKTDPAWYDPTAFAFNYEWKVSGHEVPGAGANLRIDAATGDLLSWYLNRPEGRMVQPPAILAESEAKAAFAKLPLTLSYMPKHWMAIDAKMPPEMSDQPMALVYQPPFGAVLSQSGDWIGPDGQPLPDVSIPAWRQVPPPIVPYIVPKEPLSKAASLAIAQAVTGLSQEPDTTSIYRWDGQVQYTFGWVDWSTPDRQTQVTIDATRGLVREVWGNPVPEGTKPVLSPAAAIEAAVTFIQTYRPDLAGALYYPAAMPSEYGNPYTFRFERQHEGIMVQGYGVSLSIDPVTGKVIAFYGTTDHLKLDLPEPTGIQAPAPLMAKLVDLAGVELAWVPVRTASEEMAYELVWQLGRSVQVTWIEAQTGIFRDADGTDVLKFRLPPADVAGHWAEREINALFQQRIVTVEAGQFKPEQAMTEAEAAAWLARLNYGGPIPYAAEPPMVVGPDGKPVAPGEPNPATPITREAFVKQVVVALGYERIAGMKNQIWMDFHDQEQIEPGARNAVAVLNGLGVIRGTPEGYFLPKKSLTRAEAARILFQSLEHRRFGGYYK